MMGSFTAEWISRILAVVTVFIIISEASWCVCNGSPSYIEMTQRLFFSFGLSLVFQIVNALIEENLIGFKMKNVVQILESVSLGYRTYLFVLSLIGSMIGIWIGVEGGLYRSNGDCFQEGRME